MRYDEVTIYGIDSNGNKAAIKVGSDGILNTRLVAGLGTPTSVSSSTSSQVLLAANTNRKGATIFNNSTANLFIEFGAIATTSGYTVKLSPSFQYYEVPFSYTGVISGIWDSANGNANVRELT